MHERDKDMSVTAKQKEEHIKVKQFITDTKGQKMAAVIDIEELKRIETVLDLIPPSEAWLYKNREALESVQKASSKGQSQKT
jgi:hypothetical protein